MVSFVQILPVPLFLKVKDSGVEQVYDINYNILLSSVFVLIIFFIIYFIKGKKYKLYSSILISACFLLTYIWSLFFAIYPVDQYYKEKIETTKCVLDKVDCSELYPYIVVKTPRTMYAYQFAFPRYDVVTTEEDVKSCDMIIVDDNMEGYTDEGYYKITNVNTNIILYGENIQKYFSSKGFVTEELN